MVRLTAIAALALLTACSVSEITPDNATALDSAAGASTLMLSGGF